MNDTIAAISTAQGVGAISIIRVSGDNSINIVNKIFSSDLTEVLSHTIHYGYIVDNGIRVDEVLVSVMRAPKTFTREDIVEINAHGGINTTNKILELLLLNGARLALPGEFSKRAFLNGRIDLTEAEGIIDLINAKTDDARSMAINQVSGKASAMISNLREEIAGVLANIEVNMNYPEYDDIEEVTVLKIKSMMKDITLKIDKIIKEGNSGELLKNGINTVIVGRPNVGKSSLLNNLIGVEKAIVTDIQGTTRDSIEASLMFDNIILNLIDTAGIRETSDKVEIIGARKSLSLIDKADLVLFVLNNNEELKEDDYKILDKLSDKNYIAIVNKCDLDNKLDTSLLNNVVRVSALKDINMEGIKDKIKEIFNLGKIETSDLTYLTSARSLALLKQVSKQVDEINNGLDNGFTLDMIEIDLKQMWNLLGEIIGENYDDELIDELFSRFCVGK